MSEWRATTLGEVIQLQRGFDLTEKHTSVGTVPVISSGGISYFTAEAKCAGPGVVTGRKGVLGKVFYSPGPYWPHDTTLWVKDFKGNVPRFIYYLLRTVPLANLDVGASNPTLNRNHAHLLKVRVPDTKTQEKIAAILGALDDLLVNNRRRIELLEETTRAIYREWFVSFRYPGHEDDRLIGSDLGPLPTGWLVGRLDDLLLLQRGFDLPTTERVKGTVPVIAASGRHGFHNEPKVRGPGIVTGRSGTVGLVTYVHEDYWPLNTTLWVKEFRRSSPRTAFFLLADLKLEQYASGAAVPTLNRNHIHGLRLPVPPQRLIMDFDKVSFPAMQLQRVLAQECERLVEARDLLQPRLVSGEIDVSNLDHGMEGALGESGAVLRG